MSDIKLILISTIHYLVLIVILSLREKPSVIADHVYDSNMYIVVS